MSSFFGINLASGALRSFQRGMDTVGHNLANVDTPGYSRQVTQFKTLGSYTFWNSNGQVSIGQGVTISQINRVRDQFLDKSRNDNASDLGRAGVYGDGLARIDDIFDEPGANGISSALDKVFNAFSGLAADPASSAAKVAVRSAAQTLTDRVRAKWSDLDDVAQQGRAQATETIIQINELSTRIADLNQKINETSVGGSLPNDLLDSRDQAIHELSSLVDIKVNKSADGSFTVAAGGFNLVDGGTARPMPTTFDEKTSSIVAGTDRYSVRGGKLAGFLATIDQANTQKGQLDKLANTLRTQLNALHTSGKDATGAAGVNLFNDATPQHGAIDFDLGDEVKADVNKIVTSLTGKPGDGGLAQSMADLRTTAQAGLGGATLSQFFAAQMSALGSDASYQSNLADTYSAVASQIEGQIAANSGVSVDEEMVNMTKLQRAYQANAKMLTIFDEVLQQTIDMVRP